MFFPQKSQIDNIDKIYSFFNNKYSKFINRKVNKLRLKYINDKIQKEISILKNKLHEYIEFDEDYIKHFKKNFKMKTENKLRNNELLYSIWYFINQNKLIYKFKYLHSYNVKFIKYKIFRDHRRDLIEEYQNIDDKVRRKFLDSIQQDYEPKIYNVCNEEDLAQNEFERKIKLFKQFEIVKNNYTGYSKPRNYSNIKNNLIEPISSVYNQKNLRNHIFEYIGENPYYKLYNKITLTYSNFLNCNNIEDYVNNIILLHSKINKDLMINRLTHILYNNKNTTIDSLIYTCKILKISNYSEKNKKKLSKLIIEKIYDNYLHKINNQNKIVFNFKEKKDRELKYTIIIYHTRIKKN